MAAKHHVIDVFAGVGGLSLGAARAGFDVVAAVEIEKHAVASHKINFPATKHIERDIQTLTANALLKEAGIAKKDLIGLIGGPPCQGFSAIGRKQASDPRNSLFVTFFNLVAELRPAFFVAENVPGILADRNSKVLDEALKKVPKNYIVLKPFKVRASDFGAPTIRTRLFFIGYDPKRCSEVTRQSFAPIASVKSVTVADALAGIPNLGETWPSGEGWQVVAEPGESPFGQRLKAHIPKGVGSKDAIRKLQDSRLVSGFVPTAHTKPTIDRFRNLDHGKSDKISKCVRLDPKGHCPTLRAGTGPEKGSYQAIRPVHPELPRVICTREAARLQGFPDWFQFHETKWHSFRQIGNSVSPIVAEAILSQLKRAIELHEDNGAKAPPHQRPRSNRK
jgi:DNA (cytosine-5)-methyltransferase 1